MPNYNKTKFPDTPKTEEEFRQAQYVMKLWILQYEMGLSFEDARLMICNCRFDEKERILKSHGCCEGNDDYVQKYELLEYYISTLESKYKKEFEERVKRFDAKYVPSMRRDPFIREGEF